MIKYFNQTEPELSRCMKIVAVCCCCCCKSGSELLAFYYCGTADNSTHYSAKTREKIPAHGAWALQHGTDAHSDTVTVWRGRRRRRRRGRQVCLQTHSWSGIVTSNLINGTAWTHMTETSLSTLLSRTLPPSWITFTSALSSPAEAEAEADASSWLFPSCCTEPCAPMANQITPPKKPLQSSKIKNRNKKQTQSWAVLRRQQLRQRLRCVTAERVSTAAEWRAVHSAAPPRGGLDLVWSD